MESENLVVSRRVPRNKGKTHWAEAAVKAPRNLGDPDKASDDVERS
jgi:hypothetical protein